MKKRIMTGLLFISPVFLLVSIFTSRTQAVFYKKPTPTTTLTATVVQDSDTRKSEWLKKVHDQDEEPTRAFNLEVSKVSTPDADTDSTK
jgi:hypothetical protein